MSDKFEKRFEELKLAYPKDKLQLIYCTSAEARAIQIKTEGGLWTCIEHDDDRLKSQFGEV